MTTYLKTHDILLALVLAVVTHSTVFALAL